MNTIKRTALHPDYFEKLIAEPEVPHETPAEMVRTPLPQRLAAWIEHGIQRDQPAALTRPGAGFHATGKEEHLHRPGLCDRAGSGNVHPAGDGHVERPLADYSCFPSCCCRKLRQSPKRHNQHGKEYPLDL